MTRIKDIPPIGRFKSAEFNELKDNGLDRIHHDLQNSHLHVTSCANTPPYRESRCYSLKLEIFNATHRNRPYSCGEGVHKTDVALIKPTLVERNQVGDNDLRDCRHTTASQTLHG